MCSVQMDSFIKLEGKNNFGNFKNKKSFQSFNNYLTLLILALNMTKALFLPYAKH